MKQTLKHIVKKAIRYALSPLIVMDYFAFKSSPGAGRFSLSPKDFYPCVKDKTVTTGFDRHYVYHTAWAARVVKEINPIFHVDISSSLYFSALVSAFIPVHFYDYRPAKLELSNLESKEGNLHNLPFSDKSVTSISCMHTLEHVGLGRYGDPIDAMGDIKAINDLKRVTAVDGNLIIVVPVGKPKIEYNAHRIYSFEQITSYVIDDEFELKEFSFIPQFEQDGGLKRDADPSLVAAADYACGCFWFKRKAAAIK